MRFITVRDLRLRGKEIWEALRAGEEAVLTCNGRPVALLVGIEEGRLEETLRLVRRVRAQAAVSRMRERARELGLDRSREEDIGAEVRAVRREQRSQR
ncbi:type II toxin-antitoxin system Phd/YefM family antitoxin [Ammonifex thiophilus]|uniref:Prevent-host-death protein n=1 Tax=Ammonifex thiophilus TaxID=444093 RepID=A0A3D8P0R0_9THEO|nr:prevent-host-death protein [Ammonifex thiophilus]RDV80420.1 prevent-host-death protein [Ammonifex thiophilus]